MPVLPARHPILESDEDDSDAIQAEGALEARGTVNLWEPPAEQIDVGDVL